MAISMKMGSISEMRRLPALSAIGLSASLALSACGTTYSADSSKPAFNQANPDEATTTSSGRPRTSSKGAAGTSGQKDSNDLDSDGTVDDDSAIVDYGLPASKPARQAIVTLIERYYAAAAIREGAKACAMLVSPVAEAVSEEYGAIVGHPHGTCAVIMSKLFAGRHRRLVGEHSTLKVTRVRLDGGEGLAVLQFGTTLEPRKIPVHFEDGRWKIQEPFDSGMP